MDLKIVMAAELEFYLLDANADRPTALVPRVPGIGRPQPGPQVYNPDDLWDIEQFLNDPPDRRHGLDPSARRGGKLPPSSF